MQAFERGLGRLLNWVAMGAGVVLLLIALTVTFDVAKRWFTGRPITGVFESVELMMVVVSMGVLGLVEWQHRQLNVDVFTHRARGRTALGVVILDKALAVLFMSVLLAMAGFEWVKAYNGWYLRRGMVEIPIVYMMGMIVAGAGLTWLAAAWGLVKALACLPGGRIYRVPDGGPAIGGAPTGPATGAH